MGAGAGALHLNMGCMGYAPLLAPLFPRVSGGAKIWPLTWTWVTVGTVVTQARGEAPRLFLMEIRMQPVGQAAQGALAKDMAGK